MIFKIMETLILNADTANTKQLSCHQDSLETGPGARFSKDQVTLRARNQIFKSKYKE